MSAALKKRASNERVSSHDYHQEGLSLPPNGSYGPSGLAPYGRGGSSVNQPRSISDNAYANASNGTARDTALRDYSSSTVPNGNGPLRATDGSRYYPTASASTNTNGYSVPQRSNNLGPNPTARVQFNPSLHPSQSPTSRTFGRRADSPPASSYFPAVSSSAHQMAPAPGQAEHLGEHFSFSTTLRRHTLGPAEEIGLPSFGALRGGGGDNGEPTSLLETVKHFGMMGKAKVEKLIWGKAEDNDDEEAERGGQNMRMLDRAQVETVSARYAPMPYQVRKLPHFDFSLVVSIVLMGVYLIQLCRKSSTFSVPTQKQDCQNRPSQPYGTITASTSSAYLPSHP